MNKTGQGIPWGLLRRMGDGSITDDELEGLTKLFQKEAEEPPGWFIARALRAREQAVAQQRPSLVSRLVASLVFDTGLQPHLAGVRGGDDPVRRMSYMTGCLSLHLEARKERDGLVTVSGQALAEEGSGPVGAELIPEGGFEATATACVDEFGFFSLPPVKPSSYRLVLSGEDTVIDIPRINVGTMKIKGEA
jgi:hypothetical protein